MISINYTAANEDASGSVTFEYESMVDVCGVLQNSFGIKLTIKTFLKLLEGVTIQSEGFDVWIREEN